MDLDAAGLQTTTQLKRMFTLQTSTSFLDRQKPAYDTCSVGLEIEVPWRAYFPHLWAKHFQRGTKDFANFSVAEAAALDHDSKPQELCLNAKLGKTLECGLDKGRDWYWEFIIPPVRDVRILAEQVAVLNANDLCPWGPYSLQPTIGGLRRTRSSYFALLILELLFASPERIAKGINAKVPQWATSWARKGQGGIARKSLLDLKHGDTQAIELRTLCLPASLEEFYDFLTATALLATWLYREQCGAAVPQWDRIVAELAGLLTDFGLDNANWENPHTNPAVWEKYITCFYDMKAAARQLLVEISHCSSQ